MQDQWDVLVIGAGPAGLNAASAAAECGLDVILLDEQESPGGQIYRSVSSPNAKKYFLQSEDLSDGLDHLKRFYSSGAKYLPKTTVWFAEPGRVICSREGNSQEIKTQILIVATGAMERPVPFEGWTLPGVMGAGAADILYKSAGVVPDGPVVLAGNGPLIPLVGSHLVALGVEIAAVLDTSPFSNTITSLTKMPAALSDIPFLLKGVNMLKKLMTSGVPMYHGVGSVKAFGNNHVEGVSFTSWNGKDHALPASTLLFHEGVIPRIHMSRMLKLKHAWNNVQRYWHPVCDLYGKSSRENIYVVGDGSSVHGVGASALKGELAGIDAARALKVISKSEAEDKAVLVKAKLKKNLAPRGFVDKYFAPHPDIYKVADDVLVCRCEGVKASDIRQAVAEGYHEVNEIKLRTRCGMGPCQGRMCGPALAEIAALELDTQPDAMGLLNIRPPIRPVKVFELCKYN